MVAASKPDEIAAIVFIDIAVVMAIARLIGAAFRRIRQPAVIGEILAGILLGPTVLGALPGELPNRLFPPEARPFLSVLAQLGLIIFMFIVGLELDVGLIKGKGRIAAVISASSVAIPFSAGMALAATLHGSHRDAPNAGEFLPFALFIGASMSVTAFPVLARILTERRMHRTEVGALTLACAAVDDILAWSLLAVVVAIVASTGISDLPRILVESALFGAFAFAVVKPRLKCLVGAYARAGRLTPNILAIVLIGMLVSAYVTSEIGIHSIFGAFLFGAILPREGTAQLFKEILERLEQVSVLLLLPVFFIVTGLNVDVRGLGREALTQLPLILMVAVAGKLLGATLAARAQGIPLRKAGAIGVLMNTRGLTELVLLNVGLDVGVLDRSLFTMLVVMAVVTTVMTEPLLRIVYPDRILRRDIAEAEKTALGVVDAYRVVVVIDDPDDAAPLVELAADLVGDEAPAEVILARFTPSARTLEVGAGLVAELAEVASSLEELREWARRVDGRGVKCTVRAQFSSDVAEDLLALAGAVEANVVIGTCRNARRDPVERLWRETPGQVALLDLGGPHDGGGARQGDARVIAVEGNLSGNISAAAEIAVRVARSRGAAVSFRVGEDRKVARRMAELINALKHAGVPCHVTAAITGADLVVAAVDGDLVANGDDSQRSSALPTLLVRAAVDADGRALDRLLRRIGTREHKDTGAKNKFPGS